MAPLKQRMMNPFVKSGAFLPSLLSLLPNRRLIPTAEELFSKGSGVEHRAKEKQRNSAPLKAPARSAKEAALTRYMGRYCGGEEKAYRGAELSPTQGVR